MDSRPLKYAPAGGSIRSHEPPSASKRNSAIGYTRSSGKGNCAGAKLSDHANGAPLGPVTVPPSTPNACGTKSTTASAAPFGKLACNDSYGGQAFTSLVYMCN